MVKFGVVQNRGAYERTLLLSLSLSGKVHALFIINYGVQGGPSARIVGLIFAIPPSAWTCFG